MLRYKMRVTVYLWSLTTLGVGVGLVGFLPEVAVDINESVENHQVG